MSIHVPCIQLAKRVGVQADVRSLTYMVQLCLCVIAGNKFCQAINVDTTRFSSALIKIVVFTNHLCTLKRDYKQTTMLSWVAAGS